VRGGCGEQGTPHRGNTVLGNTERAFSGKATPPLLPPHPGPLPLWGRGGPIALAVGCVACLAAPVANDQPARIQFAAHDAGPFARATAVREFTLPEDHGPHYEYQTEWWYYTGNLETRSGRRFGYQLTFFRRGLSPGRPPERGLQTNQVYLAHFALSDPDSRTHLSTERLSRGAGGLAGATGAPFRVWLEDWEATGLDEEGGAIGLRAEHEGTMIELSLRASKPLVAHGNSGLSAKSAEPGNASYYIGYTRLATAGTLHTGGETLKVTGTSWFDHEWSTSALGTGAVGWDWFSLQLDDGRDVMLFQIRREDGGIGPASSGTLVDADGTSHRLDVDDFELRALRHWRSGATGASYPVSWHVSLPGRDVDLEVTAVMDDQEMQTSFLYWEGAVDVTGTIGDEPLRGRGYLEMTGYASSMQGVF